MNETPARKMMVKQLIAAAIQDERIVGLLDYGSSSEGRVDEWSDIDVEVFVRDADYEAFMSSWKDWAAQFGTLLLAYVGGIGHPWTIYAAEPIPLRVDFDIHRESEMTMLLTWPNSPVSVESMVLCDKTNGRLTAYVQQLVGQSLQPYDLQATFDQVCGDFWYYLLYTYCKFQRGQHLHAYQTFTHEVLGNLLALLRLEANALERWRGSAPAWNSEQWLSPARLAQLWVCISSADESSLVPALQQTSQFGQEVCAAIGASHQWEWPEALGREVVDTFS